MPKSFLSRNEKHDLAKFIAGTGENYSRYTDYANTRNWTLFTPYYFRRWVQRHRRWIVKYREMHVEELRKLSIYDRERRIQDLEDSVDLINSHMAHVNSTHAPHECSTCGLVHEIEGPEVAIKLMLAKSKILEQIAKERNEWMKPNDEIQQSDARTLIGARAMEVLSQARETKMVDGTVVVADD